MTLYDEKKYKAAAGDLLAAAVEEALRNQPDNRAIHNIHEEIGWHTCANLRCEAALGRDHVVLLTTAHLRRFCSVDCVVEGLAAWREHLYHADRG